MLLPLDQRSQFALQGTWVWLADHDLDGHPDARVTLYSGRGILSESVGPVWMIGTASEHHALYQYSLVGAQNHYMGLIQTETVSPLLLIFRAHRLLNSDSRTTNLLRSPPRRSRSMLLSATRHSRVSLRHGGSPFLALRTSSYLGRGFIAFSTFVPLHVLSWPWLISAQNYSQDCETPENCQNQILSVDSTSSISIYSLATAGTTWQISVNQVGLVNQNANPNGFAATVTSWTR
jgi:glucan 1,3-beta-glucosidase